MNKLILAYLAGVIDSDGFISIREQHPSKKYPHSVTYTEFLGVGQTSPEAIKLLAEMFGGTVRLRTRKDGPNWKPIYYWNANNKKAANCAAALLPYLRIKRRQAELLLSIRASKEMPKEKRSERIGIRWRKNTEGVLQARKQAFNEIRKLNGRGIAGTP